MTRWEDFKASRLKAKCFEEALGTVFVAAFVAQLIVLTVTGGF